MLLGTFAFSALIPALATSVIATAVAWIGLGSAPQYSLPQLSISSSLVAWSILVGPMFGLAAYLFVQATKRARIHSALGWRRVGWCAVVGALRAGAAGGLLTPGLSMGGLLGILLGGAWSYAWPAAPLGAFAVVGSAAFLASSMNMPLTAIVLIFEFTRVTDCFLVPISLAVAGSAVMFRLCTQYSVRRTAVSRTAAVSASGPEAAPIAASE